MAYYRCIGNGSGGGSVINLTKQQYDALSTAEKNNGSVYKVAIPASGTQGLVSLNHFNNEVNHDEIDGIQWISIDANGATPSILPDQKKFGDRSLYLCNWAHVYAVPNNGFLFEDRDFTIDMWMYPTYSGRNTLLCYSKPSWYGNALAVDFWYSYVGDSVNQWMSSDGSTWDIVQSDTGGLPTSGIGNITIQPNQWQHIAIVRNGTSLRTYVNGVVAVETTISANATMFYDNDMTIKLGVWLDNNYPFTGFIDEFCVRDYAVWTSNFTPPTQPYDIYVPAHDVFYYMSNEYDTEPSSPNTSIFKDYYYINDTNYWSYSSDRKWWKYNTDDAAVCTLWFDDSGTAWHHPFVLISETPDGAKCYLDGTLQSPAGTITVNGRTLYYSFAGYLYNEGWVSGANANFNIQVMNSPATKYQSYYAGVEAFARAALK